MYLTDAEISLLLGTLLNSYERSLSLNSPNLPKSLYEKLSHELEVRKNRPTAAESRRHLLNIFE